MSLPKFVILSSGLYAALSAGFSIIGLFPIFGEALPKPYLIGNPLEVSGISVEHIVGHVVFGLIVGAASLGIRYIIIAGLFPIALDADHLIQFLNLDAVPRLGHSFLFAAISAPIMMYLLGKSDYRLAAISFASVFSHVSFDILLSGKSPTSFPILIPFSNKMIGMLGYDWVYFFISGIIIVASVTFIAKKTAAQSAKQTKSQ